MLKQFWTQQTCALFNNLCHKLYPLFLRVNIVFQQQNQATCLKPSTLLPLLLFLYIHLFAIHHYAQTWSIGLQSLTSILPTCLTEKEVILKRKKCNTAFYIKWHYLSTLHVCTYIKKQMSTQRVQPDADSEYSQMMVNFCPSAANSVVK